MINRSKQYRHASHDYWQEEYRRCLSWPMCWLSIAESLRRSANILWEVVQRDNDKIFKEGSEDIQPSISQNCLLLLGLSMENLLKGICVSKYGAFNNGNEFKFTTHNLLVLCEKSGVEIAGDEYHLLELLEQFVIWAGKFPGPLKYTDLIPRYLSNDGFAPLNVRSGSDIINAFKLIDRLTKELKERL